MREVESWLWMKYFRTKTCFIEKNLPDMFFYLLTSSQFVGEVKQTMTKAKNGFCQDSLWSGQVMSELH